MFRDFRELISKDVFHPSRWTWRFYVVAIVVLLSLNLFGTRGIIHGLIITQEERRLQTELVHRKKELADLQHELTRFQNSDIEKFRALREELGFLRTDEISVEFMGPQTESAVVNPADETSATRPTR